MNTPRSASAPHPSRDDDNNNNSNSRPSFCPNCACHQAPRAPTTLKRRRDHGSDGALLNDDGRVPGSGTHPTLSPGAPLDGTVVGAPLHKRVRLASAVEQTRVRIFNSTSPAKLRPSGDALQSTTTPAADDSSPFASLPPETVRAIVSLLNDRDYLACMLASSRFHVCSPQDVLLRRYAARDIFDSNETLADIQFVCARYGREPQLGMIVKAASRGRHDIVMYIVQSLGARAAITSWTAPKPSDPDSPDARACVKDALCAALDGNHMRVISALAQRYGFNETVAATGLMARAARLGRLNVVKAFHNAVAECARRRQESDIAAGREPRSFDLHIACRSRLPYGGNIQELTSVGMAAWNAGHVNVLDWLIETQCPGACVPNRHLLEDAVAAGRVVLARWAASKMGQHAVVGRRAVDEAAAHGHVGTVRWAHESNLRRCSVSTIQAAVHYGRPGCIDVLRWAAGEAGRPPAVPEWRDVPVALIAAREGNANVIRWLYEHHPECVTPEAARHAARAGHNDVVLFLHKVGVAPVTRVSLLGRAVKSRDIDLVDAVAAAGAPFKQSALVFAIRYKLNGIVTALCRHYAGVIDPKEAMRAAGREGAYKIARVIMTELSGACIEHARESIPAGRSPKALGKCMCCTCKPTRTRAPASERRLRPLAAHPADA
ncbi:F-box domain containing protein [Pandoravirus neocaledonia]|uniref:F-box domain containing protein n=1 Tax=Pandoravirus neocaledonia TaxID=2107708 RepID=A0A2U7UDI7_9VIRU|nr:F-box domain containing protein [Pandoravirus neocaledonia]AVK76472.1 F-box domain containing protein [Pandoravirus neocaledonia]